MSPQPRTPTFLICMIFLFNHRGHGGARRKAERILGFPELLSVLCDLCGKDS
jgi:hypothetical protein